METITLTSSDGEELIVYVVEETTLNEVKYLLVSDENDEEAFIMRAVAENDDEVTYEFVEDEVEFEAVSRLFEELLDEEVEFE